MRRLVLRARVASSLVLPSFVPSQLEACSLAENPLIRLSFQYISPHSLLLSPSIMRTAAALVALAATATVASAHWPGADAANARKRHSDIKRSSGYQLSGYYAGQDFLNLFDFATGQSANGFCVIVCMSRSRARVASADRLEAIRPGNRVVCVCTQYSSG